MRRAIGYYEQQLTLTRARGNRAGEGHILGDLGGAYKDLGEPQRAMADHEQALDLLRALDDRRGVGHVLNNLGLAWAALGAKRRAIGYYEQALEIAGARGSARRGGGPGQPGECVGGPGGGATGHRLP